MQILKLYSLPINIFLGINIQFAFAHIHSMGQFIQEKCVTVGLNGITIMFHAGIYDGN